MPKRSSTSPARSRSATSPSRSRSIISPANSRLAESLVRSPLATSPVPCCGDADIYTSTQSEQLSEAPNPIWAELEKNLKEWEARHKEIRSGFVKKVFGLVAAQLVVTAFICATVVAFDMTRQFVLKSPNLLVLATLGSFGLLGACHGYRHQYPANLKCLAAFTANEAYLLSFICSVYYDEGFGTAILVALGLTSLSTIGLTIYALRSKKDFSFMGAGLHAALWALILAPILGFTAGRLFGMNNIFCGTDNLIFGIIGALLFCLFIVYDVWLISQRIPLDDYVHGAICLYLDIVNLFLEFLKIAVKEAVKVKEE
jgi:protein lifeguard